MCRTAIASSQPTSSSVVPAAPSSQISRAASMMRTRVRSPRDQPGPGVHVIRHASRVTLFLSLTTQSLSVIVSRVMSLTAHFEADRVGYTTHFYCTSFEERP